jgi:hypothetical protein
MQFGIRDPTTERPHRLAVGALHKAKLTAIRLRDCTQMLAHHIVLTIQRQACFAEPSALRAAEGVPAW